MSDLLPSTLSIRDLRRDGALAPGGARFGEVVRRFLPLTHGTTRALIPESPEGAEAVVVAVFQTLAFRWRRLSRNTLLAPWLLRTVWYAAAEERSRRGLGVRPQEPAAHQQIRKIIRLKARDAALLIADDPIERVAPQLKIRLASAEKRKTKLERRCGKFAASAAAPPETEEFLITNLSPWTPRSEKTPLVKAITWRWRWLGIGQFVKRVAAGLATAICCLVAFGVVMQFLIMGGHINVINLGMRQAQRSLLKEFPGLGEPAKPFPASTRTPRDAAELFGFTNIWTAKISFTREQWARIQPVSVPPARSDDGQLPLRNPKARRSGLAGAIGIDFPWSEGGLEFAGAQFEAVGIRLRGNGTYINSLYGPKQPFKIDLNRVNKDLKLAGVTTLNLANSVPDFSYLKDALAEKLFREIGAIAPRTAYAYLTIDVPGKFANQALGLYVLIEDIDAAFAKDRFGTKSVPIFKPVTRRLFEDWGPDWSAYRDIYDLKTKATEDQLARVIEFARLVTHAGDEEFARKLPEFLDFEEYAAFLGGHVLMSSYDGYLANGQNFYMYLDPRSNKFGFIPWDQDHGWGEFAYVSATDHRENASIWKPAAYNNHFLSRVLKVESFRKVYRGKLEEALAGPFTVERLNREIDSLAAVVRPAIAAESAFRLERFEITISDRFVEGPRDSWHDKEGPRAPHHQLKRFVLARTKSIRDQLDGKSQGTEIGR